MHLKITVILLVLLIVENGLAKKAKGKKAAKKPKEKPEWAKKKLEDYG